MRRNTQASGKVAWALGAVAAAAMLAGGCTNAQLVNVWRDPDFGNGAFRSVLVVSQRSDPTERRLWEDAVRQQLGQHGIEAVASYTLYPETAPTRAQLGSALQTGGLDGALIFKSLAPSEQTYWVPGYSTLEPRAYYDPWGRPLTVVRERYHRGYPVTDRYARVQITAWSAENGGTMVWAGTAEILNPSSSDDVRHDLANAVVPEMRKARLVPAAS